MKKHGITYLAMLAISLYLGGCLSSSNDDGSNNDAAPTGLSYTTPVTFIKDAAITPNTPTVTGVVTSYSVSPSLPTGLTINTTTGVISGTPTVTSPATNYTVTAGNSGGSTTTIVNITVNDGGGGGGLTGVLYTDLGNVAGGIAGLAVDASGNAYTYFTKTDTNKILKITTAGVVSAFTDDAKFGSFSKSVNNLYHDGTKLYGIISDTIVEFSSSGVPVMANAGLTAMGVSQPHGLTKDASGNFFVGNYDGLDPRITKITATGVGSKIYDTAYGGVGDIKALANGDLLFTFNDDLLRLPSGASAAVAFVTGLQDSARAAYVADSTIPIGAVQIQTKFSDSFAKDGSSNLYTRVQIQ